MFKVKVFPEFKASSNASNADKSMLAELKKIRKQCGSLHVSFSAQDYQHDKPDNTHFVTYPMGWFNEYIRSNYLEIDPLLQLDYRRISYTDWQELQSPPEVQRMFEKFREFGLGSNGITVTGHVHNSVYGAMGLTFNIDEAQWTSFKKEKMDLFRFLSNQLCEKYGALYNLKEVRDFQLTARELQCLQWVAMGKTDDQIAELLKIGKWTVVSHVKSAKYKLGTPNRASAVALAVSQGLFEVLGVG